MIEKRWKTIGLLGKYDMVYECPVCQYRYLEQADGYLPNIHDHTCNCGFHEVLEVAYQRLTSEGDWVAVNPEDIPHYKSRGQLIRNLYAGEPY